MRNEHHLLLIDLHQALDLPHELGEIVVASLEVVEGEPPVVRLKGEIGMIVPDRSEISNKTRLRSRKWG